MMGPSLGERCGCVMQSVIRSMSIECARIGVIKLSQGDCDTSVPIPVLQGDADAIMQGGNTFTHRSGIRQLRETISDRQRRFAGMELDPDSELVHTADVAARFDLSVFTEEIYECFVYDGLSHFPIANLPGILTTRTFPNMQPEGTSSASSRLKPVSGSAFRREPVTISPISMACGDRRWGSGLSTSFGRRVSHRFRVERAFMMREAKSLVRFCFAKEGHVLNAASEKLLKLRFSLQQTGLR